MKPITFKEQTVELQPNPNQLEIGGQSVGTLPIFTDGDQCISRWNLSIKERLRALFYGHIWLGIHCGRTQPPVWMSAERSPFAEPKSQYAETTAEAPQGDNEMKLTNHFQPE